MNRITGCALACALIFSSVTAHSAAESSASITGLKFTLVDLDVTDGIAPSFSFVNGANTSGFSFYANYQDGGDQAQSTRNGFLTSDRKWVSDTGLPVGYDITMSGSGLQLSGFAAGESTHYAINATAGNSQFLAGNLALSANSLLIIRANAEVYASATNPANTHCYGYCLSTESAHASASMTLHHYSDGTFSGSSDSLEVSASARGPVTTHGWDQVYDPAIGWYEYVTREINMPAYEETLLDRKTFTVSFANESATTRHATFHLATSVRGSAYTPFATTPVTPVPEPGAYALLLAGLAVVGGLASRRTTR